MNKECIGCKVNTSCEYQEKNCPCKNCIVKAVCFIGMFDEYPIQNCKPFHNFAEKYHREKQMKQGSLKVWWIPQIPMSPFEVNVKSIAEACLLMDTLAKYDLFQYENNIKPDYANVGGLSIYEDGEWVDWCDEAGDTINEYLKKYNNG
jgi:Superinfection exclusion gene product 17